MRPVPVVRRPMAFVDQLSVSAAEREESQSPGFLAKPSNPRFRWAGGRRWDRDTYSSSCGPRGSRTRRTWTSGCGRSDDHTCDVEREAGAVASVHRVENPKQSGFFHAAAGDGDRRGRLETYRLHSVWLLFLLLPKLPVPLPILPMVSLRCDAKRAKAQRRDGFSSDGALALEHPRVE